MRYIFTISKEIIESVFQLIKSIIMPVIDLWQFFKNLKNNKKGGVK